MQYLLGLDIGSSSVKVSLVDGGNGAIISQNFMPKEEIVIKTVIYTTFCMSFIFQFNSANGYRKFIFILFSFATIATSLKAQVAQVVEHGFLYEDTVPPTCHASTIVEADNGEMIATFFGGSYEGHPDSDIWMCRRKKTNGIWTKPEVVCDGVWTKYTAKAFSYDPEKEKILHRDNLFDKTTWLKTAPNNAQPLFGVKVRKPCYNPVLYKLDDGDIILDYKIGSNMQDWTGWEVRSKNNGKKWSHPRMLAKADEERHLTLGPIKNKPILNKGRIIAGSSTEVTYDSWKVHFETSDDNGLTWTKREVNCGDILCIQPTILSLGGSHLKALCRTRHNAVAITDSYDNGTNWTPMKLSSFPNNNSGIDAVTMSDGRHVVVYNDTNVDGRRSPLSIAISDDGEHWQKLLNIEPDDGKEYSYPSIIQASDDSLWVLYTWHRRRIAYAIIKIK